jgi:hypothetical protein
MVNSANSECLLCGALARGHFVPFAEPQLDIQFDSRHDTDPCLNTIKWPHRCYII